MAAKPPPSGPEKKKPSATKRATSGAPSSAARKPRATSSATRPAKPRVRIEEAPPSQEQLAIERINLLATAAEPVAPLPERPPLQRHLRKYAPVYALAVVVVLMLVILPTRNSNNDKVTSTTGGQSTTGGTTTGGTGGTGTQGGTEGGTSTVATTPGSAIGTTRAGFNCDPGTRQLPWSAYAVQCQQKFSGSNGGTTARGVTATTIKLLERQFGETANSQAVAAFGAQAGAAAPEVTAEVRSVFLDYFNRSFELYSRHVEIEKLVANPVANATDEAQSKGKEGACIDATKAASEGQAYGVLAGSGPFSECAAERQVVVFQGGAYFPETWYRKYDPYVWHTVTECERISYQVAEYIGKRLAGHKAKWAGDTALQSQTRKFGTYVPNNDEYQQCVGITERQLLSQFKVPIASRYNYTLDISRFPEETTRGVLQFKAAGITTMIQAADPISTSFLTQAATAQAYHPEWFIIGVAAQDTDGVARLFDQKQTDGHLFGMSQLSQLQKLWGPSAEPGITYKKITGKNIPSGTVGDYFLLMQVFNFLQSAGPNLTPQTMAQGVHQTLAGGPPDYAVGYTSYADGPDATAGAGDHTAIDDSREVYWCGSCTSALDGKKGTYIETYGGRRFRNGEWPAEEPPVYPAP